MAKCQNVKICNIIPSGQRTSPGEWQDIFERIVDIFSDILISSFFESVFKAVPNTDMAGPISSIILWVSVEK